MLTHQTQVFIERISRDSPWPPLAQRAPPWQAMLTISRNAHDLVFLLSPAWPLWLISLSVDTELAITPTGSPILETLRGAIVCGTCGAISSQARSQAVVEKTTPQLRRSATTCARGGLHQHFPRHRPHRQRFMRSG